MSERRDKLNEILRDLGYDVRGDIVVVRQTGGETLEVRRSEHALVTGISTDIGPGFRCDGIHIERFRKNPVVLWVHDYDGRRIARSLWERTRSGDSEDDARILVVKIQFHLDTELSHEVWALVKDEAGVEWQLGVLPAEWHFDGGPRVTKWDLVEISAAPSDECAEVIRQRIKDRTISSLAMLRSVKGMDAPAEPTSTGDEFDEAIGPYRYDWENTPNSGVMMIVCGPGFKRRVDDKADACARVDELNAAWRHGHDYVVADELEPPTDIEERVAELERWRGEADRRLTNVEKVMIGVRR